MSRLCPIKPLLRQLGDNANRASPGRLWIPSGTDRLSTRQPCIKKMVPFVRPISDRYFEDYVEGDIHRFGTIAVGADEVVAFANQFDPQTFHTDPEAAKRGPFGGLIASGWHTAGLMTRLFMDHYLTKVASLGSPGGDELRWVKPVRPGDTLSERVTVLKAVPSKSKPDRGAVTSFVEVINQAGEVVMTFKVVNIIAKRLPESRNHSCDMPR